MINGKEIALLGGSRSSRLSGGHSGLRVMGFVLGALLLALTGCRDERISDDPTLRLVFSKDTVCFDTIFTSTDGNEPSATKQVMLYNPNKEAVLIDRVWMNNGQWFKVNVDGEANLSQLKDLQINGGDSIYIFVHVGIDEQHQAQTVWVTDSLHFLLANGNASTLAMEAYGQDVIRIRTQNKRSDYANYHFLNDKPYLIYDTMVVTGDLTMDKGARLYMHKGASIYALGNVTASGSLDEPIVLCGDRLDNLFDSVPYRYAAGAWNGFYLQATQPQTYELNYVDILSGNIGLFCSSECQGTLPKLTMNGCRIHNHAQYGLVLFHVDAEVVNSEISNCASYCVYTQGGAHTFTHSTIASYFGYTNIRIQNTGKEDVAAVCIYAADSVMNTTTSFYNSIITGYRSDELSIKIDTTATKYAGMFAGNYLKTDSTVQTIFPDNRYYEKTDTAMFVNNFYKYKEYIYYDFHLDSVSPARGIGDKEKATPKDRDGIERQDVIDAGCYQYRL